ncbi:Rieske 2Fe-2S domain-containing protein [Sphingosinicella soli]|uniref:Rieske 2Fe-2S domain-containing protein n=1 Tax=Sphingosinicella soli TaxID=333708 RepID=UPI00161974B9
MACRHRSVKLEQEACGNRARFTCPFHGWTFGVDGSLIGISAREDSGISTRPTMACGSSR